MRSCAQKYQCLIECWIWITKRQKQRAENVITSLDTPAPFPDETGTGTAFASSLSLEELLAGRELLYDHPCSRDHCLGCFILQIRLELEGWLFFRQRTHPPFFHSNDRRSSTNCLEISAEDTGIEQLSGISRNSGSRICLKRVIWKWKHGIWK